MTITTNIQCIFCKTSHIKDPSCLGDYYPTSYGYVLQSYCPVCGRMLPLVNEQPKDYISNNNKKRLLNRIALVYNYRFKELMKNIFYKYKDVNVKDDFLNIVSQKTGVPIGEIERFTI